MDRIPVDGLVERASYHFNNEGVSLWGGGSDPVAHNFVLYFPGDRLPGSLRAVRDEQGGDPLQLGEEDKAALQAINSRANSMSTLSHILDLQLPSVATDLLVSAFPRPTDPPAQRTNCTWHYLSIYPQSISDDGFAMYSQFLGERGLTERGEPLKGMYSSEAVTLPAIRALMVDHLRRMLYDTKLDDTQLLSMVSSLHLVGFSKGGVVLNKLITELASVPVTEEGGLSNNSLHLGLHFVDCGLHTAGAYLQERKVLDACFIPGPRSFLLDAQPLDFEVTVYTTPRQRSDPQRPWLDYERSMMLMYLGVPTVRPPVPTGWRYGTKRGVSVRCMDDVFGPTPFTALEGLRTHMLAMVRLCTCFRALQAVAP